MIRLGILASHQGTNFQIIADACAEGNLNAQVVALICNNSNAPVIRRANSMRIPAYHISGSTLSEASELDAAINKRLTSSRTELIILAGYMKKIGPLVLNKFAGRIINVHPSLLPRYGGQGYFGMRVHEAVIAAGDKETGATVHHVTETYDEGEPIRQEKIAVAPGDTPESIAKKLQPIEHKMLIETIRDFSKRL